MLSIGRPITSALILYALFVGLPRTSRAGSITYVITDFDLGSGWRTHTVPNDLTPSGILGTDGWFVAGSAGSTQLPAYLTSLISNGSVYPGNGSYASIDNPGTTPGVTPSLLTSGTLNPAPGAGNTTGELTVTFGANIPSEVQLGLMIDNLDVAGYNPGSIEVVQEGGPASSVIVSTTGSEYNDRTPDWLLFDIQAQLGETYEVIVSGGPNGTATLGAASFDTAAVPEPSALVLAGMGVSLIAVLGRTRLFRRNSTASLLAFRSSRRCRRGR